MARQARIIDAAVRFLSSNPDLLAYAQAAAAESGVGVHELLEDAVARLRAGAPSGIHPVAQQQVVLRTSG